MGGNTQRNKIYTLPSRSFHSPGKDEKCTGNYNESCNTIRAWENLE
jgi:hypothetical protein